MIQTQSSGVTQASADVEEMIGNITSVNMSVDKMAASFKSLQSNTQSGIVKQQAVNEQIQRIEQQSAMLQEANAAISAIAEQTNLLAMNVAIEAAHAGEAGKGFAVVADALHNMNDSTVEVRNAAAEMSEGNKMILQEVSSLQNFTQAMQGSMDEMGIGARKINESFLTL